MLCLTWFIVNSHILIWHIDSLQAFWPCFCPCGFRAHSMTFRRAERRKYLTPQPPVHYITQISPVCFRERWLSDALESSTVGCQHTDVKGPPAGVCQSCSNPPARLHGEVHGGRGKLTHSIRSACVRTLYYPSPTNHQIKEAVPREPSRLFQLQENLERGFYRSKPVWCWGSCVWRVSLGKREMKKICRWIELQESNCLSR